jgi:hypothetical protein
MQDPRHPPGNAPAPSSELFENPEVDLWWMDAH